MRILLLSLLIVLGACRTGGSDSETLDGPAGDGGVTVSCGDGGQNLLSVANGQLRISSLVNGPSSTYDLSRINLFAAPTGNPFPVCTGGEIAVWASQNVARVRGAYYSMTPGVAGGGGGGGSGMTCADGQNSFRLEGSTLSIDSLVNGPSVSYRATRVNILVAPRGTPDVTCSGGTRFAIWTSQSLAQVGGAYFQLQRAGGNGGNGGNGGASCGDGQNLYSVSGNVLTIMSMVNGPTVRFGMTRINLFAAPTETPSQQCSDGGVVIWGAQNLARVNGSYYQLTRR